MAQYPLRIIFDGVVAVGPACPEGEEPAVQGPLYAVMARSTRQRSRWSQTHPEEPPSFIPIHYPTVFTTMGPATERARPADEIFTDPKSGVTFNLWHPVRERLEFAFDGDGLPGVLTYVRPSQEGIGVREDAGAVPDMREIWPDRARLRPEFLQPDATEKVAAQIFVPYGQVSGGGDGEKGKGMDVQFVPSRKSPVLRKTIVPHVVVTVMVERVKVSSYSLDTGEDLDPLEFVLTEASEIRISNSDPSDLQPNLQRLSENAAPPTAATQPEADDEVVAIKRKDFERASRFLVNFDTSELPLTARARFFISLLTSSGFSSEAPASPTPRAATQPAIQADANRDRDVDLDFELFYTLLEGDDDGAHLPIPKKIEGIFDPRNCFTCMVGCHERPRLRCEPELPEPVV